MESNQISHGCSRGGYAGTSRFSDQSDNRVPPSGYFILNFADFVSDNWFPMIISESTWQISTKFRTDVPWGMPQHQSIFGLVQQQERPLVAILVWNLQTWFPMIISESTWQTNKGMPSNGHFYGTTFSLCLCDWYIRNFWCRMGSVCTIWFLIATNIMSFLCDALLRGRISLALL